MNERDSSRGDSSSVEILLEKFLGSMSDPRAAYKEIAGWLKAQIKAGRWDDLGRVIPRFIVPGLDYTSALSLHRILLQVSEKARAYDRKTKIAVLGSFTTHQLISLVELYLCAGRVGAEVYEAEYGTFRQELLDPESQLYRFHPDFIELATSWRDLGHRPELGDDRCRCSGRSRRNWRIGRASGGRPTIGWDVRSSRTILMHLRGGPWAITKRATPRASAGTYRSSTSPSRMPRRLS